MERQNNMQNLLSIVGGVAFTLLLQVAAGSLGPAGFMLVILVAVPAAYVYMRFGPVAGCSVVVLSAVGSFLLGGMVNSINYFLQFGLVALLLPYLLKRGWSWDRAALMSVGVIVLGSFLLLAGYASMSGTTVSAWIDSYANAQVEQVMELYASADLEAEKLQELKSVVEQMADYLRYSYAGAAFLVTGLLTLILLWILSAAQKTDYSIPGIAFATWKAPELLIWPLIAAGFGFAFIEGDLRQVSVNLLIAILPIYFLQGMAIVTHYFNRRQVSPVMRWVFYMLMVFLLQPISMVITSIGVFDLWIDFRKPRVKTT